ncbi:MAG: spore maturation protein A [Oscillospiraceae bacterium]|nr:spore maturation protein A [Oscillospiraceae bacterium]
MSFAWVIMVAAAVLAALYTGNTGSLAQAAADGAGSAVSLGISLCGMICLWCGVMEVMKRAGLSGKLSRLLRPVLSLLFPSADGEAMDAVAANMSANLLGLGNAATPMGLIAAKRLQKLSGRGAAASDMFALLVVINTASLQLIPVTIAAVRAANGAAAPFDILPHVWVTSAASMAVAVFCAKLFARLGGTGR